MPNVLQTISGTNAPKMGHAHTHESDNYMLYKAQKSMWINPPQNNV